MSADKELFKPSHEVDVLGYPTNPELRRLEFELCDIAAQFRGLAKDPEARRRAVDEYQNVMVKLYDLGWDAIIDLECELPKEFMPEEYLKRHPPIPWSFYSKLADPNEM